MEAPREAEGLESAGVLHVEGNPSMAVFLCSTGPNYPRGRK